MSFSQAAAVMLDPLPVMYKGEAYQGSGSRDHCPQPEYSGFKQSGKSSHCDSSVYHNDRFVHPHQVLSACIMHNAKQCLLNLTSGSGMQEAAARFFVTPIILAGVTTTTAVLELGQHELTFSAEVPVTGNVAQGCIDYLIKGPQVCPYTRRPPPFPHCLSRSCNRDAAFPETS